MKNALASKLLQAKRQGCEEGLYLMSAICLIALENAVHAHDLQVEDSFFQEVEKDMQNIFREVVKSVPSGDAREMSDRLAYYVDEIRRKRGMDE